PVRRSRRWPCRTTSSTAPPRPPPRRRRRPPPRSAERRIPMRSRSVIDMHIVNRMQAFGWPPIIAAIGLVVVLAVGAIVGTQGPEARAGMYEGMTWSGAIFALLGPLIG